MAKLPRILVINGSLGDSTGNTAEALKAFAVFVGGAAEIEVLNLASLPGIHENKLRAADAFVFATGTYWDSWGSPLQSFFEQTTSLEATDVWLGKPSAIIVTMHAVGGKEVLNRLCGVLNSLGLFVPPMSTFTYSHASALAIEHAPNESGDFWTLDDLNILAANLLTAIAQRDQSKPAWKTWPVDRDDPKRKWLT